jgi:hypothetical protein
MPLGCKMCVEGADAKVSQQKPRSTRASNTTGALEHLPEPRSTPRAACGKDRRTGTAQTAPAKKPRRRPRRHRHGKDRASQGAAAKTTAAHGTGPRRRHTGKPRARRELRRARPGEHSGRARDHWPQKCNGRAH